MRHSVIRSHVPHENVRSLVAGKDYALDEFIEPNGRYNFDALKNIGIGGYDKIASYAMDTIQANLTTATAITPLQFLQNWLPGHVGIITAIRVIDSLTGIMTIGDWEDEQIVIRQMENTMQVAPYSDSSNTPLTNWNENYVQRTVVRMESGILVGRLEEARAARIQENSAAIKRDSATMGLAIQRNLIGFYGYNSGANNTYGFFNDPGLPAYNNATTDPTNSTTSWTTKTYQGIVNDLTAAIAGLLSQSKGVIRSDTPMILAVPTSEVTYLRSAQTALGYSVEKWLTDNYPNITIIDAPQFQAANASANVFYLYAVSVPDQMSTDDMRTWIQVVPSKFQVVGVQQMTKGYKEDYVMATAGVVCKRPYAVYRTTGI